jgi:hypothetical protein
LVRSKFHRQHWKGKQFLIGIEMLFFGNKGQDFVPLAIFIPVTKHHTMKVNADTGINSLHL